MYLCGSYYHFKLAISGNISGKGAIIMSMEVDILGVDVMGVDVLGVDVMALIQIRCKGGKGSFPSVTRRFAPNYSPTSCFDPGRFASKIEPGHFSLDPGRVDLII